MRHLITVAVFLAAAPTARAQIPALCGNAATQMQMDQCAGDALKQSDAALNRTWHELMGKLDAKGRKYATDAQRAWLVFRDKECISRTGGGADQQGTIWPMLTTECTTLLTRQRTADLAEQVRCPGGDLECPAQ